MLKAYKERGTHRLPVFPEDAPSIEESPTPFGIVLTVGGLLIIAICFGLLIADLILR
jgi:hypothetical protein